MIKIKKLNEVDFENIINLTVFKNLVYLNKENPFIVMTPPLYCDNGLIEKKSKYSNYELNISLLSTTKNNSKLCEYFFESIDHKMIELGKENRNNWPFKNKDKKILYKSIFGDNDTIQFKLINSKEFNTIVFDEDNNVIPIYDYQSKLSGSIFLQLVIEFVCIWIQDNKYELYYRLREVQIIQEDKPDYILSEDE